MTDSLQSAPSLQQKHRDWIAYGAAGVTILIYLVASTHYAAHMPLWMDEVLTLWTVRQPGVRAIYHALESGAQAIPPGHPVLLYEWARIAGTSYLSLRMPSILAGLVTALSVFFLLRRYVNLSVAVLGLSLCLSGDLFRVDIQVRPYALTVACFAMALLLWDDVGRSSRPLWRLAGMALALSAAIACHFYSSLYLVCFGIIELLYSAAFRRFRLGVWISLVLSGLSIVFWLPLAHHLHNLLQAEGGPKYYAKPSFDRLAAIIQDLFFYPQMQKPIFIGLSLMALLLLFQRAMAVRRSDDTPAGEAKPLFAMALGSAALPVVTFLFARFVTGAYNDRYVLPGAIGAVLLICITAQFLPYKDLVAPIIAILLATGSLHIHHLPGAVPVDLPKVLAEASRPYPVVLAEALLFFETQENRSLTANQKDRFMYLTLPSDYPFLDSTNEHLLERWKILNPALRVSDAESFLTSDRCFYVFDTHQSADDFVDYLNYRQVLPSRTVSVGGGQLSEICPVSNR